MYTSIILYALLIVTIPALLVVAWRSKFMLEKHTGMRTEVQHEQILQSAKVIIPIWLFLVLVEVDNIIHVVLVSHDFWMFWHGFFLASLLFLTPAFIVNIKHFSRQMQRRRLQRKDVA